eukprot:scaffold13947_cov108-Isochrysis_galbana.AAC.9
MVAAANDVLAAAGAVEHVDRLGDRLARDPGAQHAPTVPPRPRRSAALRTMGGRPRAASRRGTRNKPRITSCGPVWVALRRRGNRHIEGHQEGAGCGHGRGCVRLLRPVGGCEEKRQPAHRRSGKVYGWAGGGIGVG